MKHIKLSPRRFLLTQIIIIFFVFCLTLPACGQNKTDKDSLSEKYARATLKEALTNAKQHNVINRTNILLDTKDKAIEFADHILFDVYGKKEITRQKPYKVYNIEGYWIINGSLPKGSVGGTFQIIIDSHDYRIVRITHGK